MRYSLGGVLTALLAIAPAVVVAGDDDWESPVYRYFFQYPLPIPPTAEVKATYTNETTGISIDFYELKIKAFSGQPYPNLGPASLVGYDGVSPGPTFKMTRGREALVRFVNEYSRPSAVHLHGSFSRAPFDGWAEDTIDPGQYKDYYFPNHQPARTLWYHDHAIHITAVNAYYGQAGFYILQDPAEEARLGLPQGRYDVPLMLQAKQYQSNGQLFSPESERTSLYGDVIHVNGQPWPYLKVEPRKYRFRLLDAAISRTFQLSLTEAGKSTKLPFTVVAADAGYMSRPVTTTSLYLAMAERYEIIVDFAAYKGKNITMKNARDVMKDEDYAGTDRVMQFVVGQTVTDTSNNGPPPSTLASLDLPTPKSTIDQRFKFERTNGEWRINGVGFADVQNRILAKPRRGLTELWELENSSGGWSHPIHIHLVDFQIVSRSGGRGAVTPYEAAALKDVVLLGTNEKVTVLAKYAPWDGVYMFHCHNLVHEDHDMMGAFNITALKDFGYPESTRFIDPMEQRWRAKDYTGTDLATVEGTTLPFFSSLDAYAHADEVDEALDEYHATRVEGQTTTASAARVAASSSSTAGSTTTRAASSTSTSAARSSSSSSTRTSTTRTSSSSTLRTSTTRAATTTRT
ncbi:Cupredoxin [Geopyxis carbonaria]|nr:Cupredoxin [Geopyxis carbonaria]